MTDGFNKGSANIKSMLVSDLIILTLITMTNLAEASAPSCGAKDGADVNRMVERINKRYDDFFRYKQHIEERERSRNVGRGENKARLQAHEKEIERARQLYIKTRRPPPDTREAEKQFEDEYKARLAKIEQARRCYVMERDHAEQFLLKGRKIPENKEYDLEE